MTGRVTCTPFPNHPIPRLRGDPRPGSLQPQPAVGQAARPTQASTLGPDSDIQFLGPVGGVSRARGWAGLLGGCLRLRGPPARSRVWWMLPAPRPPLSRGGVWARPWLTACGILGECVEDEGEERGKGTRNEEEGGNEGRNRGRERGKEERNGVGQSTGITPIQHLVAIKWQVLIVHGQSNPRDIPPVSFTQTSPDSSRFCAFSRFLARGLSLFA